MTSQTESMVSSQWTTATSLFLEGIAMSNQMTLTGVTHFSSCDVTDREGKLRANELQPPDICLVAIAPDNQFSTHGVRNSPYVTIYGHGIPLWHWSGSTASIKGEGILCSSSNQRSELFWWFTSSSDMVEQLISSLKARAFRVNQLQELISWTIKVDYVFGSWK